MQVLLKAVNRCQKTFDTMQLTETFLKLVVIVSIIISSCSNEKHDKAKEGLLILSARVDNWKMEGNINYLFIKTSLTNSTTDTVTYIRMSCSWQDSYTTDTKDLLVYVNECNKNVPQLIKIPPHSRQETILKLTSAKTISQLAGLEFRVGFNLVTAKDYDEMFSKVSQLTNMENVIWSEMLTLK
jgi:hypothetical protein